MTIRVTANGTRGASIPRLLFRVANGPVLALVRLLRGRGLRVAGQPVLLLTTVGARSGRQRTVPLLWFSDGQDRWLVVASSGGMANHPAWYLNVARNPSKVWIEVAGRRLHVEPELLAGAEREAAWSRIKILAPVYGTYELKTDREIPVIRLRAAPVDSPGGH
jgi:deazaflavin-dependent oxidoreductase (nitroreductase family)